MVAIVALAAGSVASALGVGINKPGDQTQARGSLRAPTGATRQAASGELGQIADRDIPEIITIVAVGSESEELGTAWPIDKQGDFITNDHVVHDGLSFHAVTASGDQYPAELINTNPSLDLAELRVVGLSERPLEVATAPAVIGQPVVVLASKGATDHSPVTESAINGLDQQASVQDAEPGEISNYTDLIRIPAKIWPGNSGGPVLTEQGAVIGILTLAAENGSGAFAIPLSEVASVIDQWLQG
jgi:S1-C subfamily serine protease